MTARVLAAVAVCASVLAAACGLGVRNAYAQQISAAAAALENAPTIHASLALTLAVVPSAKAQAPGAPRILPARASSLALLLDPRNARAAVGVTGDDASTASMLFLGTDVYQRILARRVTAAGGGGGGGAAALSNISAMANGSRATGALTVAPTTEPQPSANTTSTTSALRRMRRVPREWVAFSYAGIDLKDNTKLAGSFAISPLVVLGLVDGALTGSIELSRDAGTPGVTRYAVNVSREKAARRLPEDRRMRVNKMFTANAIGGDVFPAQVWIDATGRLQRFEVRLRQTLSNVDRADLTVTIEIAGTGGRIDIPRPDATATAFVDSLSQLISSVSSS
jgi:hypothetical protein